MMLKSNLASLCSNSMSSCSATMSSSTSCVSNNLPQQMTSVTNEKCSYCQTLLSNVSIRCAECVNFYLCLKCFSMSAEIGDHKKDHSYFLKTNVHFPIFDGEKYWSYKEELLLLQFIEQYGFGNWDDIAKHLPTRTARECMEHYHSYYIHGNLGKCLKINNKNHNQSTLDQSCDTLSSLTIHTPTHGRSSRLPNGLVSSNNPTTPMGGTTNGFAQSSKSTSDLHTTVQLPPIEMSSEEQRALGYMPLRDDFEREYKNHAETLLSNLSLANNQVVFLGKDPNQMPPSLIQGEPNEDLVDFDLKLTLIKMYRECLIERQRFKKIAREYGLINNASALINNYNHSLLVQNGQATAKEPGGKKKKSANNNTKDKEMNELNEKLKKYAQFMSVSDYETLVENLRKQRQLCEKIKELQFYRNAGLTKFAEIETFTRDKLEREAKRESIRKRGPRRGSKRHTMITAMVAATPKRMTRNSLLMQSSPGGGLNDYEASPSKRPKIEKIVAEDDKSESGSSNPSNEDEEEEEEEEGEEDDEEEEEEVDDEENGEDAASEDIRGSNDLNESEEGDDDLCSRSDGLYQEGSEAGEEVEGSENEEEEEDGEDDEEEDDDDEEEEGSDEENENEDDEMHSGESGVGDMVRRLRRLTSRSLSFSNSSKNGGATGGVDKNSNKKSAKLSTTLYAVGSSSSVNNRKLSNGKTSIGYKQMNGTPDDEVFTKNTNGLNIGKKKSDKKKKENGLNNRNGRTERLCSMPGYNLLSENEKKNSVAHRKAAIAQNRNNSHNQSLINASIAVNISTNNTSSSSLSSSSTSNSPSLNAATSNHQSQKIMMLRRQSLSTANNNQEEPFLNGPTNNHHHNNSHHHLNSSTCSTSSMSNASGNSVLAQINTNTPVNNDHGLINVVSTKQKNKFIMEMLKLSFPDYFEIPRSTRKRILRFLCDNGWIDVA